MNEIRILVKCIKREDHRKILRMRVELGKHYAETLAGLLDGTSPYYIHKPAEGSPIGKCGLCGAPLECEVYETEVTNANNETKPYNSGPGTMAAEADQPDHAKRTDPASAADSRSSDAKHSNDQLTAKRIYHS